MENEHRIRHRHHRRKRRYDEDEDKDRFSGMIDYQNIDDHDFDSLEDSDEDKYSEKKQLVALLLCLFLGPLGAGR